MTPFDYVMDFVIYLDQTQVLMAPIFPSTVKVQLDSGISTLDQAIFFISVSSDKYLKESLSRQGE
jgi:hypothetical protein